MKGIVLAGGNGSRLSPLTRVTNKHLLPVHDRPMIHYPLQTLREMGITQVMVILGGRSIGEIVELLSDGSSLGLELTYRYQREALGIAHAIGLARDFVADDSACIILGDNILLGESLTDAACEFEACGSSAGAILHRVPDPHRFGVAEFDAAGRVVGFEEKPAVPKSNSIPIGVYLLRHTAFDVIPTLRPSARGELEVTHLLDNFVKRNDLYYRHFNGTWADAGTIESLLEASNVVAQASQGAIARASEHNGNHRQLSPLPAGRSLRRVAPVVVAPAG